jgi:Flp pilus assembly protein TadB
MTALAALCGALVGLGVWTLASGIHGSTQPKSEPGRTLLSRVTRGRAPVYLAAVLAVAAVVGLLTRWPVAALLAGLGVWVLPDFLAAERQRIAQVAKLEAIAGWTESLRDTLVAAAGLEQAIIATAATVAAPIRDQVTLLAEAIRAGVRLPVALRAFGAALADPTGDLVVASLLLASTRAARNLAEQLGALAAATREEVAARRRVEKGRAKAASDARIVIATTLVMAVGLIVFNRGFLRPYDTMAGQAVLGIVGVLFAAGFRWLHKISDIPPGQRVMANLDGPTTAPKTAEVRS